MKGEQLSAKGRNDIVDEWKPIIQRHKPEIIAALTGAESAADCVDTLIADYEELTACIIELCQIAGYPEEAQVKMLAARRNLYPFQIAPEAAYFRLQVIRAKIGEYFASKPAH